MKVSLGAPRSHYSEDLISKVRSLGVEPIITNHIVRVVYTGKDKQLANKLVELFKREEGHDIKVIE